MPLALGYIVEPEYSKSLQLSLRRGRFLNANDNERAPAVVVIDETLAQKYYPNEDPLGRYLLFDNDEGSKAIARPKARIVGIVSHVNQWGLDADAASAMHAQMYLPIAQMPDQGAVNMAQGLRVYLRGKHAAPPDFETLRKRVLALDRGSVSFRNSSMEQLVLRSIASKRFTMALFAVFAALALTLANIGIYGVLSYLVGQRTQEIGIRMALGAARFDVMRMILTDGARMTATGLGIGIVAALALTHVMSSLLFGVKPTDVLTFTLVVFTLCFIALLACYIPARRAMNIDPMIALREE
jgi:predicted permease